jgi:tetratricopeptide (TPR) repeat protein
MSKDGAVAGNLRAILILSLAAWTTGSIVRVVRAEQPGPPRTSLPLAQISGAASPGPQAAGKLEDLPEVQRHYEAACELLASQKFGLAVVELDAALNLDGGPCYEVLYLLAQAKRGVGRLGEARAAAEAAALYRPGAADVHLFLGRLHREQRRTEAAIAHFRSATLATDTEPDNPNVTVAWYELGTCLSEAGYLAAAAEAFERFDRVLWEQHPEQRHAEEVAAILKQQPYGAIERRLDLLRRLDLPVELVAAAEWAFETRPDEPYLERLYVRALLDAGRAGAAFDFCRERLVASPAGDSRAAMRLTLAIEGGIAAGRMAEWITQLTEEVAEGRSVELAQDLAERLDAATESRRSVELWRALAAAHPSDAGAAWALASACKESGDLAAALGSLIEFVRRSPDRAEIPPERLAAWMRSFAVTDEFLRLVKDLTARAECDSATYTVLGTAAAAAGQQELAERLFGSAVEKRPDFVLAYLTWGQTLLAAYRWDEALEQAQRALAVAPNLPAARFLQGEAFTGLDLHAKAEQAYKAALDGRPNEVAYVLALARHYRRNGNLLAAQRYFQQAWSLDHSLGEAAEELIDCYLEAGKVEIARTCLKEAEASDVGDDVLRRIRTALRFAAAPMQAEHLAELARQFAQAPDDVRTGLKLAAGLYLNQRADEALPVLQQVRARAPEDERAVYLLARVHLRRLEYDPAITLLEQAAKRTPARQNVLRLLADAYLADFRVDEARHTLEQLLALDVTADHREQLRGRLLSSYLDFSEFDAALETVETWRAAEPTEDAWARAKLQVLLAADRGDEAATSATQRLEEVTARFDESQAQANALSERLREKPKDADAQAQAENLQRELEARAAALYDRRAEYVQVCLDAKRYDVGERQVRAWLADQPGQPQLQGWLIELLLAAKRGAQALEVIGELAPKTPADVANAFIWRAQAHAMTGNLDEGLNDLAALLEEKFVQADPKTRSTVQGNMLTLLNEARQYDRALALCERWLREVPVGDREARLNALVLKRRMLVAADRLDEEVGVAEELLAAQPSDAGLNNDLGYTWIDRGEALERGLAMIKLAVAEEPLNAAFLDSLGWAYYKTGDFAAARLYLGRAVRLRTGQDPVQYDHLGDAEYRAGDRGAAEAAWHKALALLAGRAGGESLPQDAQRIAAVRDKLTALAESGRPAVASTAADPQEQTRP